MGPAFLLRGIPAALLPLFLFSMVMPGFVLSMEWVKGLSRHFPPVVVVILTDICIWLIVLALPFLACRRIGGGNFLKIFPQLLLNPDPVVRKSFALSLLPGYFICSVFLPNIYAFGFASLITLTLVLITIRFAR